MNRISQYLVYPIVWFFSTFFFDVEFKNEDNLSVAIGKPMIIVANHISHFDSFLLRLNKHWTSLSVYFMGVVSFNVWYMNVLHKIGIITLVYRLFGVFIVIPGRGIDKNLEAPKNILLKNNCVFIFPEGSVNTSGVLFPFKQGAAKLAIMTGVPILAITFKDIYEIGKRKRIIINIGEIIKFPKETDSVIATKILEEKVAELLR